MFHRHKWEVFAQRHIRLPPPLQDETDKLTQGLKRCPCGEVEEWFQREWVDTLVPTAEPPTT